MGKSTVLPGNTIKVPLVGKNMGHPAAFPVGLPEFFMKLFTKSGDNVLDPFAGSGSTGLAAEQLDRNVVLIDNKEKYFETIKSRLGINVPLGRERSFMAYCDVICQCANGISQDSAIQTLYFPTPLNESLKEK